MGLIILGACDVNWMHIKLTCYFDAHAAAINVHRQNFSARAAHRGFDTFARLRLDQQSDTAASACAANFSGERAIFSRGADDVINHRRGNIRNIRSPRFPFFTDEPANFVPVGAQNGDAKLLRDGGNFRKVARDSLIAINLRLENFPIINSGLARFSGVANDEARFEIGWRQLSALRGILRPRADESRWCRRMPEDNDPACRWERESPSLRRRG